MIRNLCADEWKCGSRQYGDGWGLLSGKFIESVLCLRNQRDQRQARIDAALAFIDDWLRSSDPFYLDRMDELKAILTGERS